VAYIKEIKNELDSVLTRDNSTADFLEMKSDKSPLASSKNLNERLCKFGINGML